MKFTTEVVRMFNFDPHWSTPALHEVQTKVCQISRTSNRKETKKYVHRVQVHGVAEM